jgi:hypothetical protein
LAFFGFVRCSVSAFRSIGLMPRARSESDFELGGTWEWVVDIEA